MDQITVLYKHPVVSTDGEYVTDIYTTSPENYKLYKSALDSVIFHVIVKYISIGLIIGAFIGFFTSTEAKGLSKQQLSTVQQIKSHIRNKNNQTILLSIALIESSYNPKAVGRIGEQGLFQLHPKYFKLKNTSIKSQVESAENHLTFLKRHCRIKDIVLAWNLGCNGAKMLAKPTEFLYFKKFIQAQTEVIKHEQNSGAFTPGRIKIADYKNSY